MSSNPILNYIGTKKTTEMGFLLGLLLTVLFLVVGFGIAQLTFLYLRVFLS